MTLNKYLILLFCSVFMIPKMGYSQVHDKSWREIIFQKDDEWFGSNQAKDIAENVLLYQREIGGWPKNIQMHKSLSSLEKKKLQKLKFSDYDVTTDNGATTQEMFFLSRMYKATADARYKESFLLGLNYLLEAQYKNGGWPQFYPLREGYYAHITYNDDSMVNILKLLQDLKDDSGKYAIQLSDNELHKVEQAFNKGIDCILKTQYRQKGILTAWCAQHDENTLLPAKARAYELPSLSGKESAGIVSLLMSIKCPSPEIINAITHAIQWFEKAKITGLDIKFIYKNGERVDKKVVQKQNADPVWARFMELEDNTPFFCDRDGIKKKSLNEIGVERRNGYAWYTRDPQSILNKYPKWKTEYVDKAKKKPIDEYNVIVAKDGSGDFINIQDAIYASKSFPFQRVIINIKNGVYKEKVHVYSWNNRMTFLGESKDSTIITYNDYFKKIDLGRNSTFHTPTVLIEGNDFIAKNLTIENTAGPVGQAVALSVSANHCYFENCKFLGFQDTLYTEGEGFKQYFKDCYIEGTTDFIFGEATVLFEFCEIYSKSNSYITAASTPQDQDYGYVFKNCKLTASNDVTATYLGRPWRFYAKTVFIECQMGKHIRPEGWHNWNKPEAEKLSYYAEYNCSGKGFQPESRVTWSHQLKRSEAKLYTKENILGNQFIEKLSDEK